MAYSTKLILREQRRKPDGTCPVWLRITANRKSSYKATGISVLPKDWNKEKQQVARSHDLADRLNAELKCIVHEATAIVLAARTPEEALRAGKTARHSFSDFFQAFVDELDDKGAFWEWKKYRGTFSKLENALGKNIQFEDFDRAALIRFERYLSKERQNRPNTVRKELTRLRTVLRRAIRQGIIKPSDDPFLLYDRPKGERVERRKLSLEEIQKLAALDLPFGQWARTTRDVFLFSFYAAGMRFSDVSRLKVDNIREGRVEYRMEKTGHLVSLPLPPVALALVQPYLEAAEHSGESPRAMQASRYVFPLLSEGDEADPIRVRRRISSRNAQLNTELKALARQAEIKRPESISAHTSRHSWADHARTKTGNLYAISKALGHSSLTITQQYLKSFDREAVDSLTSKLWQEES